MYLDAYFQRVEDVLAAIRRTQIQNIVQAATAVAQSLTNRGALHVMDTGHMLRHEAFYRAGGLMAISPFSYELRVENPVDQRRETRTSEDKTKDEKQLVSLALDNSKVCKGDVIIINSNSGRTANVVETATQCRSRGVATIGLASLQQMTQCQAEHPTGKKLIDAVDIFIDNCGPFGDAAVEVRDNEKMCPMSGLAATYVLWAIQAEAVEQLQAAGVNPTIFRSVHVSGHAYIDKQREQFLRQGV